MSTTRFHGLTSLGLVGLALALGAITIFQASLVVGFVYLGIAAAAMLTVMYAFCAKCPCKTHCGHVLPGLLAQRFNRRPGPYSHLEMNAMLLSLLVLIAFPQAWLWSHTTLFIAFWVLTGTGLIQIRSFVCRACDNAFCPLNKEFCALRWN